MIIIFILIIIAICWEVHANSCYDRIFNSRIDKKVDLFIKNDLENYLDHILHDYNALKNKYGNLVKNINLGFYGIRISLDKELPVLKNLEYQHNEIYWLNEYYKMYIDEYDFKAVGAEYNKLAKIEPEFLQSNNLSSDLYYIYDSSIKYKDESAHIHKYSLDEYKEDILLSMQFTRMFQLLTTTSNLNEKHKRKSIEYNNIILKKLGKELQKTYKSKYLNMKFRAHDYNIDIYW